MTDQPEIYRLADDANAAMEELALFVQTRNATGAPWDKDAMAHLHKLQDDYARAARAVQDHPDADLIQVTDGPVIGAKEAKQ